MTIKPLARKENIVVQELNDEVLVYDLSVSKAYCLNETSALVWELCDGRNKVSDICERMSSQLKELVGEDLVWLALDQFRKDGLLENGKELDDHFTGLSRREVIRKVGIGSMIALPIVSSIVAPMASSAQSPVNCAPACFAAGQNACAGCTGPVNWIRYFTTGGTCSGPVDSPVSNVCIPGSPATAGGDLERI